MLRKLTTTIILISLIAACGSSHDANYEDYVADIQSWRADRLARLRAPDGFLNLAGLYWLDDGVNSFGSGTDNDLLFPSGPSRIGEFEVVDGRVVMRIDTGVEVRVDGEPISSAIMPDDTTDAAATATLAALSWTVINRDGKFGVRLHDRNSPALEEMPSIPYFDINPGWRINATLRRFEEPRVVAVGTVVEGLGWHPSSPGVVEFERDGERLQLEAYAVGDRLFFVFGDATSGRETYPAGRFLYADMPGDDGQTELDFNRSYNPPCAFNDFATCPVASPRNRLPIAIEAGEKFDKALYFGSVD